MGILDVVTVAELKLRLTIPAVVTTHDVVLQGIINGAVRAIEAYTGRNIIERAETQKFWGGEDLWFLHKYPVSSITSIADPATNALTEADDYELEEEKGILRSRRGHFQRAVASDGRTTRWLVTTVAGMFDSEPNVEEHWKEAVFAQSEYIWARRGSPGVTSRKVGDLAISWSAPVSGSILVPEVAHFVGAWKVRLTG